MVKSNLISAIVFLGLSTAVSCTPEKKNNQGIDIDRQLRCNNLGVVTPQNY